MSSRRAQLSKTLAQKVWEQEDKKTLPCGHAQSVRKCIYLEKSTLPAVNSVYFLNKKYSYYIKGYAWEKNAGRTKDRTRGEIFSKLPRPSALKRGCS